jgi:hypothetical protein
MAFLNPLVLLALAAAAIPILVHLFNFRKPRRVDFSSLQFLRELERRTMRRMRLRQWLLLALRTLAIAFLVLAFARPTVESGWAAVFGGRVETASALVIDNSLSMTVRDAQGELLTQAKELAAAVASASTLGDELYVVATIGGPARPQAFRHAGPALDAIDAIEPRAGGTSLAPALERAFAVLDGSDLLNREVLVLSDLQASTFLDTSRVPAPEGVRVTLLPLGERRHANLAVTDARVVSRVVEPGRPVQVEATLVHFGPSPAQGVTASLFLEGERVAQATVDLQPNVPQSVRFTATPRAAGWLAGEVRIEPDAFPYDDVRYLVLHVPETRRVLLVQGQGQRADLIELALTLGDPEGRYMVATIPEAEIAAQPLDAFDVVMLVGPSALASGTRAALARFVGDGGGLVLFPSERADEALSPLLAELGGGSYGALTGRVGGNEPVARFGRADLEHPLFEGVLDRTTGTPRLESPDFVAVAPPAPAAGQTLIALSGGEPFLHEIRAGQGTVLAFAAAPDPRWGDFPMRGLFVPLMHRAVALLSADDAATEGLTVRSGGAIRLAGAAEGLRLVGPDGDEFAPAQRTVPGGVVLEVDEAVEAPGIYAITDGERVLRRVAFNADAAESDLTTLAPEEAARRLQAATGTDVRMLDASGGRGLAAAERLAGGEAGVELWRLFLALALLCLVAEQLVAMRWRPAAVPA